jgi:hypothetical protein
MNRNVVIKSSVHTTNHANVSLCYFVIFLNPRWHPKQRLHKQRHHHNNSINSNVRLLLTLFFSINHTNCHENIGLGNVQLQSKTSVLLHHVRLLLTFFFQSVYCCQWGFRKQTQMLLLHFLLSTSLSLCYNCTPASQTAHVTVATNYANVLTVVSKDFENEQECCCYIFFSPLIYPYLTL